MMKRKKGGHIHREGLPRKGKKKEKKEGGGVGGRGGEADRRGLVRKR